ncbi:MAG: ATP-binding protein [Candidatus Marinimicrobia bacterium]|nr:ATP-binding protein [Candidatus Neomarinimicrobiota bacterium]
MVRRYLQEKITASFSRGKAIVLMGARQVGKTTLAKTISTQVGLKTLWLNGDEPDVRKLLTNTTSTQLKSLIGSHELLVIDEAQRITNIGLTLKLIVDEIPSVQVVATGSSSFELADRISEPLTGRKDVFYLFPLSYQELCGHTNVLDESRNLEHRMIFGSYPDVINNPGEEINILSQLSDSYLYKDLFAYDKLKKPEILEKLLQALALQLGQQVSYNELGQVIGADNQTVERYIYLLEKSYVIFRLGSFSRNLRNELKRSRKIYFLDNGIRNAVIKNYAPLALRSDTGALWENYLLSERLKANQYSRRWVNSYFWRTRSQQEIDYLEERDGQLAAYEFKWNPKKKAQIPPMFSKAYPQAAFQVITRDNYTEFIQT